MVVTTNGSAALWVSRPCSRRPKNKLTKKNTLASRTRSPNYKLIKSYAKVVLCSAFTRHHRMKESRITKKKKTHALDEATPGSCHCPCLLACTRQGCRCARPARSASRGCRRGWARGSWGSAPCCCSTKTAGTATCRRATRTPPPTHPPAAARTLCPPRWAPPSNGSSPPPLQSQNTHTVDR